MYHDVDGAVGMWETRRVFQGAVEKLTKETYPSDCGKVVGNYVVHDFSI